MTRRRQRTTEALAHLDPIDGAHLDSSWSTTDAKAALFQEIVEMSIDIAPPTKPTVEPITRHAASRWRVLAVAAAAIAVIVGQAVLFDGTPAYAVKPLPNGIIEINVLAQLRDGHALAAELREYGIVAQIETIVASPSQVGQVEIFRSGSGVGVPAGLELGADGTPDVFNWRIDPSEFDEPLIIQMRVAAIDGEPYAASASVFEPGEALAGVHCTVGEPIRAESLVPHLDDRGLTAEWFAVSPTGDPSITDETQTDAVPAGTLLSGYAVNATTVRFRVAPDGVELPPDYYSSPLAETQCPVGG